MEVSTNQSRSDAAMTIHKVRHWPGCQRTGLAKHNRNQFLIFQEIRGSHSPPFLALGLPANHGTCADSPRRGYWLSCIGNDRKAVIPRGAPTWLGGLGGTPDGEYLLPNRPVCQEPYQAGLAIS